jgi:hypothetical protein
MGKKIFVSYKYADRLVRQFNGSSIWNPTTVRNYVDILQNKIDKSDHIYKGEDDGEDLSSLADSTIGSKLGDKIFDSSVTIVFISKGMKDNVPEDDQWIPWEISYSLKEQSRESGNSKTNAVLAVVLPDESGSYDYFIRENICPYCNCRTLQTPILFQILKKNMFNIKQPKFSDCSHHEGNQPYIGHSSYIHSVKWDDFINDINNYIDIADKIRQNRNYYNICKSVNN